MYEVEWTERAFDDLVTIPVRSVRAYLLEVGVTALDRHHPPWGGVSTHGLWRRGVTARDEAVLRATEARRADLDGSVQDEVGSARPHDFVLVYDQPVPARIPRRFQVLAVVTNAEFVDGALLPGPGPTPPTPAWGGRLIRRRGGGHP